MRILKAYPENSYFEIREMSTIRWFIFKNTKSKYMI